jgi:hypothetical protein
MTDIVSRLLHRLLRAARTRRRPDTEDGLVGLFAAPMRGESEAWEPDLATWVIDPYRPHEARPFNKHIDQAPGPVLTTSTPPDIWQFGPGRHR